MKSLLTCFLAGMVLGITLCGCDETTEARDEADHMPHVVKLWSGGKAVGEWISKKRPQSHYETRSTSILAFVDSETGTYVMLRGTISVEQTE